ncbi:ATP-binding protein [Leptospira jelokensis]|uniref:ATP-binding protein n=1 Tax=Leptospira jelokensis TaxID=2484931 RepID=UPI001091188D|nr:ATP-binding protein [Leptospira jelokensis]TGM02223.1 response regulator [Leptospira jelokensis]
MNVLSKKHLLAIIKKSGIGILILDESLNIILTNQWILKHSNLLESDIQYKHISDVFSDLTGTRTLKSIIQCLKYSQYSILTHTLNPFPFPLFENEQKKLKNERIYQYLHVIPISIDDEPNRFCMIQISDVSQQVIREKLLREQMIIAKERESEAKKASQAKTDFLASMSHEIRTPLNAILGMADTLNETELSEEQTEYLTVLRNSGRALYNIINDILDFSRIESGKLEMESVTFSIHDLMKETISLFLMKAKSKGIHISHSISKEISPMIKGDSTRIQQILINLIGNAMKFTEKGSIFIKLMLNEDKSHLVFEIEDTGIGIPNDKLQSIFESFTQVDSSTTRKYGGTGLGLSITKKLILLMNGTISVQSEIGKGSTFHIEIPYEGLLHRESNQNQHWLDLELPDPENFPPCKILLAEDSDENVFIIKTFLRKYPIQLEVAQNGKEAFDKFQSGNYDLVLMDMQMPEMDGMEATKQIRIHEQVKSKNKSGETPIIAISANVQKEEIKKSFLAGITSYLAKPVRKIEILKLIYFYIAH